MNLLDIAQQYVGTKETPGSGSNSTILNWANQLGISYSADSIPWCALFMSYILYQAGLASPKTLRARDFLKVGTPVEIPSPGDIAVLWRDSPTSVFGHVGIVSKVEGNNVTLLGGNQNDEVNYSSYPTYRVLGYRSVSGPGGTPQAKKSSNLKPFLAVLSIFAIIGLSYYIYTKFFRYGKA